MNNFAELRRSAGVRMGVLLVLYTVALTVSRWLAYQLRFDFAVSADLADTLAMHWSWVIPVKLGLLYAFRQFSGLLSYFSIPDLRRLFFACAAGSLVLLTVRYFAADFYRVPRGVLLLDFVLAFSSLAGIRLGLRMVRERFLSPQSRPRSRAKRVGIIGAGDVGASLARELFAKRGLGMQPVAFFDDDQSKWRSRVHDIPVVGAPEALLDTKLNLQLEEVIIAMPTAPAKRIGEVVKLLQRARLDFETVPSLDQLATGQVRVSQLRSVEIQDLLGRAPVELEADNIRSLLAGRVVMVTGAGGSIGSELCRQIVAFNPKRLLLVEQSEVQIFHFEEELAELGYRGIILPLIADILDTERMRFIFERFEPEVLFHAAAYKHVPMMESQPSEAFKNNTLGTAGLAELALEYGVDRFVLVSTDKAINPTNVMGATKRLAEIFLQSLHASVAGDTDQRPGTRDQGPETRDQGPGIADQSSEASGQKAEVGLTVAECADGLPTHRLTGSPNYRSTKFMAVRFGNVLGSSGSVVPIFNKQIAAGGPVKVTHPDVTRYFMTIPEAAGLVLQSAAQGTGGEIFVLDMGQPVKIVDLARQLIELSGLRPEEDIEIVFTGLRPGEKLFEELSHKGENITSTHHPKIMRFVSEPLPLKEVRSHLEQLTSHMHDAEPSQFKLLLKTAVPEYQPYLT